LIGALAANVATGGEFDYQRVGPQSDVLTGGFQQLPQFRDVSNFNVGLFGQQAGLTLGETLSLAGTYAKLMSGNASSGYVPNSRNYEFTVTGYETGASGVYGY
jgi:hypothetical protein